MFFTRKKKETPDPSETGSGKLISLSEGTLLLGDIQTKSNIRIECDVKGRIVTSGRIVVSEGARIEGNIQCGSALVLGLVKGNIVSSGEVSLKVPAKVTGNILASNINVEKGVVISGLYKIVEQPGKSTEEQTEQTDV